MLSSAPFLIRILIQEEEVENTMNTSSKSSTSNSPTATTTVAVKEDSTQRRIRREVANSNERRRMEGINAGYNALLNLLPRSCKHEKMSKAVILKSSVLHLFQLKRDNAQLRAQNSDLQRKLLKLTQGGAGQVLEDEVGSAIAKKPKIDLSGVVETCVHGFGISEAATSKDIKESARDNLVKELIHLRLQLDIERRQRLEMEKLMGYSTSEPKVSKYAEITQDQAVATPAAPTTPEKQVTVAEGKTETTASESSPPAPADRFFLILEAINRVEGKEVFKPEPEDVDGETIMDRSSASGAISTSEVDDNGKKHLDPTNLY